MGRVMRRAGDPKSQLEFLEAAYAWDLDDRTWLERVVRAAAMVWGRPVWACGYEYDASDVTRFRLLNEPVFVDAEPTVPQVLGRAFGDLPPEIIARTYRKVTAGFGRAIGALNPEHEPLLAQIRTADYFGMNGLDPSGVGCFVGIGSERVALHPHETGLYERLSSHLSAAYRLRRRLGRQRQALLDEGEAVVHPDGKLLELRGFAREADAREAIEQAAQRREQAKRREGSEPTGIWLPRVGSRWTLVDAFDQGGQRYIVARENQSQPTGLSMLTDREQQVVASAASGRSIKEIAYELGISDATARVLLSRAYRRFGVRSRRELFELPLIKRLRGDLADN